MRATSGDGDGEQLPVAFHVLDEHGLAEGSSDRAEVGPAPQSTAGGGGLEKPLPDRAFSCHGVPLEPGGRLALERRLTELRTDPAELRESGAQDRVVGGADRGLTQRLGTPALAPTQHVPRLAVGEGQTDTEAGQIVAMARATSPELGWPERREMDLDDPEPVGDGPPGGPSVSFRDVKQGDGMPGLGAQCGASPPAGLPGPRELRAGHLGSTLSYGQAPHEGSNVGALDKPAAGLELPGDGLASTEKVRRGGRSQVGVRQELGLDRDVVGQRGPGVSSGLAEPGGDRSGLVVRLGIRAARQEDTCEQEPAFSGVSLVVAAFEGNDSGPSSLAGLRDEPCREEDLTSIRLEDRGQRYGSSDIRVRLLRPSECGEGTGDVPPTTVCEAQIVGCHGLQDREPVSSGEILGGGQILDGPAHVAPVRPQDPTVEAEARDGWQVSLFAEQSEGPGVGSLGFAKVAGALHDQPGEHLHDAFGGSGSRGTCQGDLLGSPVRFSRAQQRDCEGPLALAS